jgi:hypothetical protein
MASASLECAGRSAMYKSSLRAVIPGTRRAYITRCSEASAFDNGRVRAQVNPGSRRLTRTCLRQYTVGLHVSQSSGLGLRTSFPPDSTLQHESTSKSKSSPSLPSQDPGSPPDGKPPDMISDSEWVLRTGKSFLSVLLLVRQGLIYL